MEEEPIHQNPDKDQKDQVAVKMTDKIEPEVLAQRELVARLTRKTDSNLAIDQTSSILVTNSATGVEVLRRQLEFYFGDPNLSKDTFMRNLIAKHPKGYVELKVLIGFHRVNQILSSCHIQKFEDRLNLLRNAVDSSGILKLCKQKLRAKRRIPFDAQTHFKPENISEVDSRTIYVENIPETATHEVIAQVFRKYGHILLVSLPKEKEAKASRRNKGFCFIEFEVGGNDQIKETAQAALTANNSIPKEFMIEVSTDPVSPLRVISKTDWNCLKEEFKEVILDHSR